MQESTFFLSPQLGILSFVNRSEKLALRFVDVRTNETELVDLSAALWRWGRLSL